MRRVLNAVKGRHSPRADLHHVICKSDDAQTLTPIVHFRFRGVRSGDTRPGDSRSAAHGTRLGRMSGDKGASVAGTVRAGRSLFTAALHAVQTRVIVNWQWNELNEIHMSKAQYAHAYFYIKPKLTGDWNLQPISLVGKFGMT